MGDTGSGVQKPHIVVDLRHGAHRRTWVPVGGFLVDGDRRGQALDALHIRLLHLPQELAGVGGEGLHVTPLALRVDRIKGQGGFPGAG